MKEEEEKEEKDLESLRERISRFKREEPKKLTEEIQIYRSMSLVFSLGLSMVGSLLIGFYIGSYIDRRYHSFPTFTLIFLLLGVVGGGYSAYKLLKPYLE